ncbi:CUB and sushi domain-containing protein 3-like [Pyrgilauda ruficollis]|uniref:CUB and sushi domain-containing protein 3-like n=1 Tax=Pyrgilauda ruficollis TaxID=221976 RepID=UPI001B863B82|nr:CUB and sushi domain-containing protein 3-like [Pyrgilauda ruficollis]
MVSLSPVAPGELDTYWSGTAPICVGGCRGRHKELKRSQCGNGSCCWLGYKSFCRGKTRGKPGIPGDAAGLCATQSVSASSSLGRAGTQPGAPTALSGDPCAVPVASSLPRLPAPAASLSAVNCGRPEADFNSVVHGNDWWVGSVVRYSCRPGFLLLGDPASACQSDGQWTPKPSCLRICLRGRIEISERDLTGECSSSCGSPAHPGAALSRGCIQVSACVTKLSGWPRWFQRCDICECDCHVPCGSSR